MVFPSSVSPRFEEIDVSVENSKILQDPRCKYLGFIIDEKLKWTKHIELVCIKLVKFLRHNLQIKISAASLVFARYLVLVLAPPSPFCRKEHTSTS
jgi:hypothetical protein